MKSEADLECHFDDEVTCDRFLGVLNSLSGRLVIGNCESSFSSCFIGHCFQHIIVKLCNCSHFTSVVNTLKSFLLQIMYLNRL